MKNAVTGATKETAEKMKLEEALNLPWGTRVRGKIYEDGRWSYGTVVTSQRYGSGVVFDDYVYAFPGDCHGFEGMSKKLLDSIEVVGTC